MSNARSRSRTIAGLLSSVVWLGLALWWTFRSGIPQLEMNAWGDWAAGISAPLAFLWLVLGYMQQGAEIKQNTAELARSVDAQNRLVQAAERQAIAAGLAASSGAMATVLTFQPVITILNFAG